MSANEQAVSLKEHQKAFAEVSFLLDAFATTVAGLMGGATASVGRIAGRNMGRKMPVYLPAPTLDAVLAVVQERMCNGFDMSCNCDERGADVAWDRCAVRDICRTRRMSPGGDLCRLFHYFVDGMINELCLRPTKTNILESGDRCRTRTEIR